MRTQTIMESTNVLVDDHSDFSEFSKEEAMNKFVDEAVVEYVLDKELEEPVISIAIKNGSRQSSCRKFVATKTNS